MAGSRTAPRKVASALVLCGAIAAIGAAPSLGAGRSLDRLDRGRGGRDRPVPRLPRTRGTEIGRINISEPGDSELIHSVVAYDADGGNDTGTGPRSRNLLEDLLSGLGLG